MSDKDAISQALIVMKDEIKKLKMQVATMKVDVDALEDRVKKLESEGRSGSEVDKKLDRIISLLEELVAIEKNKDGRNQNHSGGQSKDTKPWSEHGDPRYPTVQIHLKSPYV